MKERILRNIFSHSLGRLFEMSLGILLIPFLIKVLGARGFGIIILAESVIRFFDMAVSGLITGLGRYIGISFSRNNKSEVNAYMASGERVLIVVILLLSTAGGFLWHYFPILFNVPPAFQPQVKTFIFMMLFSAIVQICFIPGRSVLYSFQRFDLLNIYNAFRNVTRYSLCFLVYSLAAPKLYYYGDR